MPRRYAGHAPRLAERIGLRSSHVTNASASPRIERIGKLRRGRRALLGFQRVAVQTAGPLVDRDAVRGVVVAIRVRDRLDVPGREQLVGVAVAEDREIEVVLEPDAQLADLVLAQRVRLQRIKSAVVVEAQRPAVHLVAVGPALQLPLEQVPVRDVVALVGDDDVLEVARDEVDPALVDEQSLVGRDAALASEPFFPPREERQRVARTPR